MGQYRRFFALPSERVSQDRIRLVSQYNHIARVLRCKVGDRVIINFNDGIDNLCAITDVDEHAVYMDILDSNVNDNENTIDITLFVGCLKGGNMDLVIQKAVELGANNIIPFTSRFSISSVDAKKAERLSKICMEAGKQCGRAIRIDIQPSITFDQVIDRLNIYDKVLFCYEKGGVPIAQALQGDVNSLAVIVGSEGGFADSEADAVQHHAVTVGLGRRILRAETASFYALSVIDSLLNSAH
ncbi:MAG: 16S rRNA (uracil(1498)-N(3))-methyltransferase [Clostridia bacterium]|nr:16S rRNA (uracil(1498)-N(3))-methyltransferase [Clostridia bacterium]